MTVYPRLKAKVLVNKEAEPFAYEAGSCVLTHHKPRKHLLCLKVELLTKDIVYISDNDLFLLWME